MLIYLCKTVEQNIIDTHDYCEIWKTTLSVFGHVLGKYCVFPNNLNIVIISNTRELFLPILIYLFDENICYILKSQLDGFITDLYTKLNTYAVNLWYKQLLIKNYINSLTSLSRYFFFMPVKSCS